MHALITIVTVLLTVFIALLLMYVYFALLICDKFKTSPEFFFGGYECIYDPSIGIHDLSPITLNNPWSNHNLYYLCCLIYQLSRVVPCAKPHENISMGSIDINAIDTIYSNKVPYFRGNYPVIRICYDRQQRTTFIFASSAKSVFLLIRAYFSMMKQVPWNKNCQFHSGMLDLYNPVVLNNLENLWFTKYKNISDRVYFIGHSLGGSGAALMAHYLCTKDSTMRSKTFVFRTGSVRCGDSKFAMDYDTLIPRDHTLHLLNSKDVECLVPPSSMFCPFHEIGTTKFIDWEMKDNYRGSYHSIECYIQALDTKNH